MADFLKPPGTHSGFLSGDVVGARLDWVARMTTGFALASLPFQGFAGRTALVGPLLLFDVACAVAVLASLPRLARGSTRLLHAPALRAAACLGGAAAVSELVLGHGWATGRAVAEQLWGLLLAAWVAVHAQAPRERTRCLTAVAIAGAVSVVVGLGGWCVDWIGGSQWFTYRSQHPVFADVPRYLGTVASSPQRAGNLLILQLGALAALGGGWQARPRKSIVWWMAAGALALAATASFAWLGAVVLVVGWVVWPREVVGGRQRSVRGRKWIALAIVLTVAAVASYPMTVGQVPSKAVGDCHQVDAAHQVAVLQDDGACRLVLSNGRTIPTYAHAKWMAWDAFRDHWLWGVGYRGFGQFADRWFERRQGGRGSHYRQPHGLYHGFAAKHGVVGLLGLLGALGLWFRSFQSNALSWTVTAFLVIGLHFDVDRLRELWVCLGLVVGQQMARVRPATVG